MNLAALWVHERTRVGATPPPPPLETNDHTDDRRVPLKRHTSSSTLTSKKKASVVITQHDSVYKRLVEKSALPLTEITSGDGNEFAIEYADRAPRRFVQHHPSDANVAVTTSASDTVDGPLTDIIALNNIAKLSKRKSNSLQPVVLVPKVTPLVAAATTTLPRRNPRKRGNGNSLEHASHAFKPYVGDMFSTRGDYVEGMLYMSRMKRSHRLTFGHDTTDFAPAARGTLKDAVTDAFSAAVSAAAVGSLHLHAGESTRKGGTTKSLSVVGPSSVRGSVSAPSEAALLSDLSPEEISQLRQRQRCSLTLSNWSSNPENARLMVHENVVEALILLCKASDGDRVTKLHCVTTFMNLSHVDELRSEIVQQGAVKTLVEIANDAEDDKTLRTACAVTLCNLCCCLEGEEEILVEDGAVSALSLLMTEHPKTAPLCLSALYNLTCVKEPYHKIESVLKVFAALASSTQSPSSPNAIERDEIIAKALCNLSNFKRVRLRLMEEGIVSAVSNLIHPKHPFIQQLLAYVFLNLSAMRTCRSELVAKGCLGALIALTGASATHDGETKCLVALSLWNLSKEPGNRLRMVFEGFLLLVNELCRGSMPTDNNTEAVRAVCARAIYNISCSEETRLKLVERDAVNILSTLTQRCVGEEGKKMCTLSLCNLLSVQQAASDIVTAGAITSLIELSMVAEPQQTLETRHLFSKALYGLCEMATTRAAVVQAGIVPAIIHLSSVTPRPTTNGTVGARQAGLHSEIRARCTAALACLAGDDAIASVVSTPDVTRCVINILVQERFNVTIERFCCACLSLLCRDEQCSLVVADEGALEAVLSTCLESQDVDTKASCCHVLASMSCHRSCCMALVNMGALPVLETLAKTGLSTSSGSTIQRCCAITLANLSSDKEIRSILVTCSIVPLLSVLSNSYSEDSQRDCARVLCNLSTVDGHEATLVQEGALGVLMMISMVRALQPATKETCVRAFANLLTPATAKAMIHEGIVKVLPVFAGLAGVALGKTGTDDTAFVSSVVQAVSVIFAKLLQYEEGRLVLTAEPTALRALVSLRQYRDNEEGNFYEHLMSEIIFYDQLRERSVEAGIVEALQQLAMNRLSAGESVSRVALMVFTLAKYASTRQAAASTSCLSILTNLLSGDSPVIDKTSLLYSVSTACHLAWHDTTRVHLSPLEITQPLTRLLQIAVNGGESAPSEATVSTCLLTLCCLSDSIEHRSAMLQEGIVTYLFDLMHLAPLDSARLLPLCCSLFRQLSHASAFEASLVRSSSQSAIAIKLFCLLANRAASVGDHHATLDCADALCSITFLSPTANQHHSGSRPVPFVRRQSQPQHYIHGSMAVASSIPPPGLISPEVLEAIGALMRCKLDRLEEMRWRCMAALYAFSCIADYRYTLVRLGCSRLLVGEATRTIHTTSPVELATLRCCAGTLCNLTIVTGTNATANAQTMINDDAVPALIQLAKRENDEIREYCTLALSNLSAQSPKVETGAVSALLHLSLSSGSSLANIEAHVGVSRPPPVVDARYKEFTELPDHTLELEHQDEVLSRKYEAVQGQASKPPPPQVPVLSSNLLMVGGLGRHPSLSSDTVVADSADAAITREEAMFRRRKTSSIGDMMGISPMTTPASGSRGDNGGIAVDGDLRGWQTIAFPKIDPVESRALSLNMDDADDPAATDEAPIAVTADLGASMSASNDGNDLVQPDDGRTEGSDVRSESETKTKPKATTGLNSLSPLARIVVRKSQTSQAVNKLKSMRSSGGMRGVLPSSTSSLPLATVEEAHEPNNTTHASSSRRLPLAQLPTTKRNSLQKTSTPKQMPQYTPVVSDVDSAEPLDESTLTDPSSSVATAAAAAMLYSSWPTSDEISQPNRKHKTKTKTTRQKSTPVEPVVPAVTTIEDVQAQVKLLGLWN